ncbi:hypothetical protein VPNG_00816 [Cytospora leucostoma]|uniref:LrgB-like protein n=1 Tax=Cytospora leucostoma TaxID=1230097 RepID=A0A423XNL4_9PEZI|nr:hypothetical protein VPNG_00816 [Cytospora leucostoma]
MTFAIVPDPSTKRHHWDFGSHPSEITRHCYNVLFAIGLFFSAQLLTCAWDQLFWAAGIDFPGQIAAMLFVWLIMCAGQVLFFREGQGLKRLYHQYLRAPTEVLNKHMSIGFTVPLLNLISQPFAGADQVGLLTAAFVVTGILNSILVYLIAYQVQLLIIRLTMRPSPSNIFDLEATAAQQDGSHVRVPRTSTGSQLRTESGHEHDECLHGEGNEDEASRSERSQKHISDVSTLCTLNGYVSDLNAPKHAINEEGRETITPEHARERNDDDTRLSFDLGPTQSHGASSLVSQLGKVPGAIQSWMWQNVFLALSALLFLLVGLPASFLCHNDLFLDVGFLFTVWLTFTSAQSSTKQHISHGDKQYRKTLTAIATLLNPVLWTSLFLVAYGLAKSGLRNQAASRTVANFTLNNTVSNIIGHHIGSSDSSTSSSSHLGSIPIGAGDIATSILNAGIVSWGLRLFEYRHQIISRGGVTVIVTSLVASLFNVIIWPLLASKIGVRPASSDLSFAARSVTIALGGPAMKSLGGDAGVNAVGVVVNGICFQLVAGLFVGGVSVDELVGMLRKCKGLLLNDGLVWNGRWTIKGSANDETTGSRPPPNIDKGALHVGAESRRKDDGGDGVQGMYHSSGTTHLGDQQQPLPLLPISPREIRDDALPTNSTHQYHNGSNGRVRDTTTPADEGGHDIHEHDPPDDVPTVANGVTIGINAAAMGTAHLYEQNSHAAPYASLSMTMFGVFTVLFAVKSPLTEWLVAMVDG